MADNEHRGRLGSRAALTLKATATACLAAIVGALAPVQAEAAYCARTLTADVVALDQPMMFNRLGAQNVNGMMYALRRDVVSKPPGGALTPGNVALRPDKRPRPLVLRGAAGDCLTVNFQNLLAPNANPNNAPHPLLLDNDQVADRKAGFHPLGVQLVDNIGDDSSYVGQNATSSLVGPGGTKTYKFFLEKENTFMVYSYGATTGGEGAGGQIGAGLWGAINVQPKGANFYRSQVTDEELRLATKKDTYLNPIKTPQGQPVVDYGATYPNLEPWISEGKAGLPILNMLDGLELVHSDINAIVVGSNADGSFTPDTYPLESVGKRNPTVPNRLEAFREYTVIFHDETATAQAFPLWYDHPVLGHTLHGVRDSFMINYGSGGIGSEIIANRIKVGPMHDCLTCAYEEFFLTAYAVGDPAMLVDVPANVNLEACTPDDIAGTCLPFVGPKATKALYPDDPSNVHHSYIGDFVKFRNLHAGPKEQHIFHLHNHQWLFNPNDDNSNYIDAQGIGPGSGYTYEINYGGSGNRNKTAGDAIFHCHFYPHFAQGMWELWRIHDTFEAGTELAVSKGGIHDVAFALQDGTPALSNDPDAQVGARVRALPDGEIAVGTPIPAVVPMPGKAMAPMPGRVTVVAQDLDAGQPTDVEAGPESSQAEVIDRDVNPGYPFWVAGLEGEVGQRMTTPPLDMMTEAQAVAMGYDPIHAGGSDGGLPRHALSGYKAGGVSTNDVPTPLDFTKFVTKAKPVYYPEDGTDLEKVAMAYHAQRTHASSEIDMSGTVSPADFITNGSPPVPGAPFQEPCVDDRGNRLEGQTGYFFDHYLGGTSNTGSSPFNADNPRVYKAANIQLDVVFNKAGYHYPQQRIITLWDDVQPTLDKVRPPEPFVIRLNTFDCAKFLHANLVPEVYELDDYQVRTPTDIIGQHIHLPKWDLTSADGSGNGWNYEDGTLSPGTVRERIHAINHYNDLAVTPVPTLGPDPKTHLEPEAHPYFGAGPNGEWLGARTTIQRWFADPVYNVDRVDRGLGVIFTHDHYGPSTHQQVGLYATVLVEPAGSTWVQNETGTPLGTRHDGGPTSWQAAILTGDLDGDGENDSYREFYFEYSDFQHAYEAGVWVGVDENGDVAPPDANSFRRAINPSFRQQASTGPQTPSVFPDIVQYPPVCPGGLPRPCPEAISADDPGMLVVNYRNEPVGLRVYDPNKLGPDGKPGTQADGVAGDLAFALSTTFHEKGSAPVAITRAIPDMNKSPAELSFTANTLNSPTVVLGNDPFTPMMRAYPGDVVRVKVQAGAHEHEHNIAAHGIKWLQGGSGFGQAPNSGWRNGQNNGISEQFTFKVPMRNDIGSRKGGGNKAAPMADYAYAIDNSQDGWWSGVWGLMRTYNTEQPDLPVLPNNENPKPDQVLNRSDFNGVCPLTAQLREYTLIAMTANELFDNATAVENIVPPDSSATMHEGAALDSDGGTLVYNPRNTSLSNGKSGPLHDPTGLLYVLAGDLEPVPELAGKKVCADNRSRPGVANPKCDVQLTANASLEPPTLRAAAGECVEVTLFNRLPEKVADLAGYNTLLQIVNRDRDDPQGLTTFQNNLIRPSSHVGLHAQMVEYDITQHDGVNVGINQVQTVAPVGADGKLGKAITYRWYAGDISAVPAGSGKVTLLATPVEFGGANIGPADKIKQGQKGLVAALVIEPKNSTWTEDVGQRSAATVEANGKSFRDFAVIHQKGLNHRYGDGTAVENIASEGQGIPEDSHDAGQQAINFGSEPLWFRFGIRPDEPFGNAGAGLGAIPNAHKAYSNGLAGVGGDPVTPVFTADAGDEVRMRLLMPTGVGRGTTFNLHGHLWARDPYVCETDYLGLVGKCGPYEVGSQAIGYNESAIYLGHQESVTPMNHFDIVLPSAGGANKVKGDYLFRDQASFGNLNGLWGILRVNGE